MEKKCLVKKNYHAIDVNVIMREIIEEIEFKVFCTGWKGEHLGSFDVENWLALKKKWCG